MSRSLHIPTVVIGAGAAGLMCGVHAGQGTVILDHAKTPGEKIRISGGGRCNFINLHSGPHAFLSQNPHFAKSALNRYSQWDFIDLVDQHKIAWHEKTLGQLFCDESSQQIIDMLLDEAARAEASLWLNTHVNDISHDGSCFQLELFRSGKPLSLSTDALVIASGGKSIPKIGATDFGYRIARQFGHKIVETRPALVPLTFGGSFAELSGLSVPARISCNGTAFEEGLLFTHRGLSGPSILQVSSYWRDGDPISVHLMPGMDLLEALQTERSRAGRKDLTTALGAYLPKRLAADRTTAAGLTGNLADQSDAKLRILGDALTNWHLTPTGSEGYRKAEVTLGGVDTDDLQAKTMESRSQSGLYFIGEVVDVTGWLGGYNFHWAWASGVAAGQAIRAKKS